MFNRLKMNLLPHHTVTNHMIVKDEKYRGEFIFSGHFQDKSLFLTNSRIFPGRNKIPEHFQVFQDAYEPCKKSC